MKEEHIKALQNVLESLQMYPDIARIDFGKNAAAEFKAALKAAIASAADTKRVIILEELCGVLGLTEQTISITQDDATRSYLVCVRPVGRAPWGKVVGHGRTLQEAIDAAADAARKHKEEAL